MLETLIAMILTLAVMDVLGVGDTLSRPPCSQGSFDLRVYDVKT